jgi:hypothetical protein
VTPEIIGWATAIATAATTPSLSGLVQGATLLVTVEAVGNSASVLGNPVITDTLGTLAFDDTPNGLTSTIEKDANVSDSNRQCLTAIYAATVGADLSGTITATVANASIVRIEVYQVEGTVSFFATGTADGALALTATLSPRGPTLTEWVLSNFAQHEYSIPSAVDPDTGTTMVSSGSLSDGTSSGSSVSLRWLGVTRFESTDDTLDYTYLSGGGWCHAASAVGFTITGTIGGGGGGTGGNEATETPYGVGVLIEAAFDSEPYDSSHVWTDITADVETVAWKRGRRSELVPVTAGSGELRFTARRDRKYDPSYADGPYFGKLLELVPIRVSTTFAGETYRRAFGFAQDWRQEMMRGDVDAATVTTVEFVDAFQLLEGAECPVTEYELKVRQHDDLLVYFPLDDTTGGATRDASGHDFEGQVLTGHEARAVSPYAGNGMTGPWASGLTAAGHAVHDHPDGDVPIRAVDLLLDVGVQRFPDYSGSGTETYTAHLARVNSGLNAWRAYARRTFSTTPVAGRFTETTEVRFECIDGVADDYQTDWVTIGSTTFFDPETAEASLDAAKANAAAVASKRAKALRVEAERVRKNLEVWAWVEGITGRDNQRTLDLVEQQKRAVEAAQASEKSATEDQRAAAILAAQSFQELLTLDVARPDFVQYRHVAARLTTIAGPTSVVQVYVDGQLATTATAGASLTDDRVAGQVGVWLSPRGVGVGHIAAYTEDLDPQTILEHHITAKIGLGVQKAGDRARMVLRSARWPTSYTDVAAGSTYVRGAPIGTLLQYLSTLAEAEQTRFFVAGDGKLTFPGRIWQLQSEPATVVQATFADDDVALHFDGVAIEPASLDTIVNNVIAVRPGGLPQRRYVPTRLRRATRTRTYSGTPITNDDAVRDLAAYVLRRHKDRQVRIAALSIFPRADPDALFPVVFGLDLGHRVAVERTPHGVGDPLAQDCIVEGVEEIFSARALDQPWLVRLYLVPAVESAAEAPWFAIGVSAIGEDPFHF